jgi:hypothetical protein
MPEWLLRIVWSMRRKRSVIVHFKPSTGQESSIGGVLIGRWRHHYVLFAPYILQDAETTVQLDGALEVPAESVLFLQVVS